MGSILSPLLLGIVGGELKAAATNAKRMMIVYVLAAFFAACAFLAASAAIVIYLSRHMRAEAAALTLAAVFLGICLVLLAITSVWAARARRRQANKPLAPKLAAAAAIGLLPVMLSNRLAFGAVAASLAGYALARGRSAKSTSLDPLATGGRE